MSRAMRAAGWALLALPWAFVWLDPAARLDGPGTVFLLHFLHLLLALGIVALLWQTGRGLLRRAGLLPADPAERLFVAVCAGFLALDLGLFALAAAGALRAPWVWLLAVAGALAGAGWGRSGEGSAGFPPNGREEEAGSPAWGPGARMAAWGLGGLLALLLGGSLLEALVATPQSPDGLAYHLAYPRLFARAGGFVFTPHSPHFFAYSGAWEVFLSGVAAFVASDASLMALAQVLHLVLGMGGTALGLFCLGRRLAPGGRGERVAMGLFAAALYVGMRPDIHYVRLFPLLAVAPKSDLFVATLQVAALLALWHAGGGGRARRGPALLTGLFLGAAAAVKLTGGVAALALGGAFLIWPLRPLPFRERLRIAGWAAAGCAAALAPALLKNAAAIGNPLYPLLTSVFPAFDNPLLFSMQSGLRKGAEGWTGAPVLGLALPSAPFLLLAGALWRRVTPRPVTTLLLAVALASLVVGVVFSSDFSLRYVLFVPAFAAIGAAAVAGGLVERMRTRQGTGRLLSSRPALAVAWGLVFALAVLPTHVDNRLRRAWRVFRNTPGLRARVLAMSPTSRFQATWPGRLPPGARPLTFYRPERLFAFSGGWRPVVAIESPKLAPLIARRGDPRRLERALVRRGFTHVYFQPARPVPKGFPLQPGPFAAYLRRRPPLWRAAGFAIYAIGKPPAAAPRTLSPPSSP